MRRRPKLAADRWRRRTSNIRNRGRSSPIALKGDAERRRRLRLDRNKTFDVYVWIAVIPTTVVIMLGISVWAHDTLIPGFASFIWRNLAWYGDFVVKRPTLLLALLFTVLFVWSVPWEALTSDQENYSPSKGYRRGRRMLNYGQAQEQAKRKRHNRRRHR